MIYNLGAIARCVSNGSHYIFYYAICFSTLSRVLYDIPDQRNHDLSANCLLFTIGNVKDTSLRLQNGQVKDHSVLQSELLIHGLKTLAPILARVFTGFHSFGS